MLILYAMYTVYSVPAYMYMYMYMYMYIGYCMWSLFILSPVQYYIYILYIANNE